MIPLSNLKQHLRIPVDDTSEDALLLDYEAAAVVAIERYVLRHFGPEEVVMEELHSGDDRDVLWLSSPPVDIDEVVVETFSGSTWSPTTEFTIEGFALYHTTSIWPHGLRNVRVTYRRGYAPGEEPEAIRQAVRLQVADWYANREAAESHALNSAVRSLIGSYRRLLV